MEAAEAQRAAKQGRQRLSAVETVHKLAGKSKSFA